MTDGIVLHRSEFLVLLDAMKVPGIIGIDNEALLPKHQAEQQQLVQQGVRRLAQRGWLYGENGSYVLHGDLMMMASVVALPQIVFITVRETAETGGQLFCHYLTNQYIVEQTLPAPEQYRLATLPDLPTLWQRLYHILPLPETNEGVPGFSLSEADFGLFYEQVKARDAAAINQHLTTHQVAASSRTALIQTLETAQVWGTTAILAVKGTQVTDARNLALFSNEQQVWQMAQPYPDLTRFLIEPTNQAANQQQLAQWLQELSK
ncbi:MAG: hypothetical protein KJ063_07180 [Anaerolineae bacterium]|nr:hypothetical protein [Anaerolineae bacterium]